jgi:hypothetical protein
VISERWPQATDLVSWTNDVMRISGVENASETAQGKAFFEWLRLFCRMAVGGMIQAHEGDYGKERYVLDAHKNLFVYGWGYCDTCSRVAEAAWDEYKKDAAAAERVVVLNKGVGYHTKYRLRLDGSYGAFDPRYGYYLIDRDAPDARVLDWAAVGDDENIFRNARFKHRSRPFFEYKGQEWEKTLKLEPVYFENQAAWERAGSPPESVFSDSHYKMGTRFHDMDFRLPKGTVIERFWDNSADKFYTAMSPRAQREWPFLPSGRFYRLTETMFDGNWPKYDPNYARAKPYLATVPRGEGYAPEMEGGKSIGQAWGRIRYSPSISTLPPVADIYSPYVLVDGTLEADLREGARVEFRTQLAKAGHAGEPDVWSEWQTVADRPGRTRIELGRPRFNGRDVTIHGVYRFQVRTTGALNALALELYFENGIMSLPQIFAGKNIVHFQLRDTSKLEAPIEITYRYQTAAGENSHSKVLTREDFTANRATYTIDAPGLERCTSVAVAYPATSATTQTISTHPAGVSR